MSILQDLNEKEGRTVILITAHETATAEHSERNHIRLMDGAIESDTKVENRLYAETRNTIK